MVANPQSQLFRHQAVAHQGQKLMGNVMLVPNTPVYLLTGILLVWVFAGCFWLFKSNYARHVSATGWIEPAAGVSHQYTSQSGGVVEKVQVKAGDKVIKGQVLLHITNTSYTLEGTPVTELLTDQIYWQIADTKQQMTRAKLEHKNALESTNRQMQQAKLDLLRLAEIQTTLAKQHQLATGQEVKFTALFAKGWIAETKLNSARNALLDIDTNRLNAEREKIRLDDKLHAIETNLARLPVEHKNDQARLAQRLSELRQRQIQLETNKNEAVVASTSGTISEIFAKSGQRFDASKPLLTILPEKSKLVARIVIPARAAGFVKTGQPLQLSYDAFPHEKFGLFSSTVSSISESVVLPTEIPNPAAAVNEPVYLVNAALKQTSLKAYGSAVPLKPGMTFTAQINTGERSMLEWLFEPLLSLQGRI